MFFSFFFLDVNNLVHEKDGNFLREVSNFPESRSELWRFGYERYQLSNSWELTNYSLSLFAFFNSLSRPKEKV